MAVLVEAEHRLPLSLRIAASGRNLVDRVTFRSRWQHPRCETLRQHRAQYSRDQHHDEHAIEHPAVEQDLLRLDIHRQHGKGERESTHNVASC